MENLKASYILTRNETLFLINNLLQSELKNQSKYFFDTYLAGTEQVENAHESLLEKNLAKMVAGQIVIEPVIELIIKSITQTNCLQIVKIKDNPKTSTILGTDEMYLLLDDYELILDTWKITPYQNHSSLMRDLFDDAEIESVTEVKDDGSLVKIPH